MESIERIDGVVPFPTNVGTQDIKNEWDHHAYTCRGAGASGCHAPRLWHNWRHVGAHGEGLDFSTHSDRA